MQNGITVGKTDVRPSIGEPQAVVGLFSLVNEFLSVSVQSGKQILSQNVRGPDEGLCQIRRAAIGGVLQQI
jgi:hypothetical protein